MFQEKDGTFIAGEDVEIGLVDRLGVYCVHLNQTVAHAREQETLADRYSTAPDVRCLSQDGRVDG